MTVSTARRLSLAALVVLAAGASVQRAPRGHDVPRRAGRRSFSPPLLPLCCPQAVRRATPTTRSTSSSIRRRTRSSAARC